jgi:hypothetical protein
MITTLGLQPEAQSGGWTTFTCCQILHVFIVRRWTEIGKKKVGLVSGE